jgi:hypothetical protein
MSEANGMARECAHGVSDERSESDGSLDLSNGETVKELTTGIIPGSTLAAEAFFQLSDSCTVAERSCIDVELAELVSLAVIQCWRQA